MSTVPLEASLLQKILSSGVVTQSIMPFLCDYPTDVIHCICTSRAFLDAVDQEPVWKILAKYRYGNEIFQATLDNAIGPGKPYNTWKEVILKDDNAAVAIPTLRLEDAACYWRYNHDMRCYCCIVQGLKWNRSSKTVDVYFDARGEDDLRGPGNTLIAFHKDGESFVYSVRHEQCYFLVNKRRHKQGVMRVSGNRVFGPKTVVTFRYSAVYPDYQDRELFSIPENGLPGLFRIDTSTPKYTMKNDTPVFEAENKEDERRRWLRFVPAIVLDRHRGRPNAWWEEEPEAATDSDSD